MLKCEELMQQDFLKATANKRYHLGNLEELSRITAFSFIKNLNNTLMEENTFIKYVRQDYVLLYTVYTKKDNNTVKLVDFAVSIDIDYETDTYTVTDCYATAWLDKLENQM